MSVKISWTSDITRLLWRQATRNKEYGLTEATTGISVESTPSSIFLDSGTSTNFSGNHHNYSRARTIDMSQTRPNDLATNKRLSWMSAGESSGSSGVFDLGSLPEDGPLVCSPKDDLKAFFKQRSGEHDVKYSSLPRKKLSLQHTAPVTKTGMVLDNNSLITLRHDVPGGFDSSFIRNNIYRKTLQIETPQMERSKTTPKSRALRRSSSGGRYATQPIVMPSSLSFSEGQSSGVKHKKVTSYCSASPRDSIAEILEEDTTKSDTNSDEADSSSTGPEITSITRHPNVIRQLSKSSDANLSNLIDLPSNRTTGKKDPFNKRRYSYTKSISMIDCNSILVDERQKGKGARQRSESTDSQSGVTSILSPKSPVRFFFSYFHTR